MEMTNNYVKVRVCLSKYFPIQLASSPAERKSCCRSQQQSPVLKYKHLAQGKPICIHIHLLYFVQLYCFFNHPITETLRWEALQLLWSLRQPYNMVRCATLVILWGCEDSCGSSLLLDYRSYESGNSVLGLSSLY